MILAWRALHFGRWSAGGWRAVAFGMLLIVALTVNPCWYFVNDWLMKYLREHRQLGVGNGGFCRHAGLPRRRPGQRRQRGSHQVSGRAAWSLRAARGLVMVVMAGMVSPAMLLVT